MGIQIKRSYEAADASDGYRILVDRLWPRGLSKKDAKISLWLKTIAPSSELRKWFNHTPDRWPEFRRRYFQELADKNEELETIREKLTTTQNVTLVYSARDTIHNQAVVLLEYLTKNILSGSSL